MVHITTGLNFTTGVLNWTFTSLDPVTGLQTTDPLAGFLPPGQEGSVSFTVAAKGPSTGTQITNKATIVFDVNPPMDTPVWSNTFDKTPPISHVTALTATQTTAGFPVLWSGTDVGSGVQEFTVYVADNGGPFVPWQTNIAAFSAVYTGIVGHTYAFYSIARDLVGNIEGSKTTAEATTKVVIPPVSVLTITNYQLISKQAAAGAQSALTYRADLINPGNALGSLTATLTSLDPFSVRVQPGQGVLNFAPVPANSQVTSGNTFTILTDASVPFDFSKLQWTFQTTPAAPLANPSPNQTVKVGSTVTLDGSGSMNPSGIGTLTYSWAFTSRPPGTKTTLMYLTTPTAQFLADVPGTYVLTLTVSNGVASSSASVTVTATP